MLRVIYALQRVLSIVSPFRLQKMKREGDTLNFSGSTFPDASSAATVKKRALRTPSNLFRILRWLNTTAKTLSMKRRDLLINGQGKYPGYNYYKVAGIAIGGKDKGQAERESPPVDVRSLIP